VGVGLSVLHLFHHTGEAFPPPAVFLALLVAASVALHVVALLRRWERGLRRHGDHAAALFGVVVLAGLAAGDLARSLGPLAALGSSLLLGVLALVAGTRAGLGGWCAAAVAATWLVQLAWTEERALVLGGNQPAAALGLEALAVVVFTAWPFLGRQRLAQERLAWYAAALAGPVWFHPMKRLFVTGFGDAAIGVLPIALGAVSLAALARARAAWPAEDPARRRAIVWFAAVALGFLSLAIPLQLRKEWITIGWAVEGLAVIALWKRLDHPGLKLLGLGLLAAASVRLVANPMLLTYYPRSATRIVNWLLYTYLVPAAALLGSAALLRPLEVARARDWERGLAVGAISCSFAAVVLVFVWINLAIADWFATGPRLVLSLGATPAQRLAVSLAWAAYALVLLGLGMARDTRGLRWLSLGFLLITIFKVFLYDLGALRDLYRVASLVGLAVSLIFVSLLYQRFVFRRSAAERP
jgi:hypothetical protein